MRKNIRPRAIYSDDETVEEKGESGDTTKKLPRTAGVLGMVLPKETPKTASLPARPFASKVGHGEIGAGNRA